MLYVVQGHAGLHKKFQTSEGYVRSTISQKERKGKEKGGGDPSKLIKYFQRKFHFHQFKTFDSDCKYMGTKMFISRRLTKCYIVQAIHIAAASCAAIFKSKEYSSSIVTFLKKIF